MLSEAARISMRFHEDATVYAVYGTSSAANEAHVTMIAAMKDNDTVYLEALRNLPEGSTVSEQGILFADDAKLGTESGESALTYQSANRYAYRSNGKELNDVTGLTLKRVQVRIHARAYVIYLDGSGKEHVLYSEIATVE